MEISQLTQEISTYQASTEAELEAYRMRFISRKSVIGELFARMKDVAADERKAYGQQVNELKDLAESRFKELSAQLQASQASSVAHALDLTLPVGEGSLGSLHPLTIVRQQIIDIFERMGFNLSEGPEIEDDWHNFTALNFPENHPAREMQDTFFIEKEPDITLRTHT
ncbi:MAG: phenylalanine--tRNA ligase subunit alpha, partial [Cytophagales bacterium]|nr:phenylalanine--tRNA ligase subunit alpha [Cytophagales bacterium]